MHLTLQECLKIPPLNRFKVMTGDIGMNSIVEAVTILDAPDSVYWMRGGELVLTNGVAFLEDKQGLVDLLPVLVERRTIAFVIKINRFLFELPEGLLEKAIEVRLPILLMSDDCSYRDVLCPVYAEIVSRETMRAQRDFYSSYYDFLIAGTGLEELVNVLSRQVGLPVVLLDHNDRVMFFSKQAAECTKLTMDAAINEVVSDNDLIQYPLFGNKLKYGSLALISKGRSISRKIEDLIYWAEILFALEIIHQKQSQEIYENDFIYSVLIGEMVEKETMFRKMIRYNLDYFQKYFCMITILTDSRAKPEYTLLEPSSFLSEQKHLVKLLSKFLHHKKLQIPVIESPEGVILLWPVKHESKAEFTKTEIITAAQELATACSDPVRGLVVAAGISSTCAELDNGPVLYQEALQALKMGVKTMGAGTITHFSDLGVYRLFGNQSNLMAMRDLYAHSVGKLEEYDKQNSTHFLTTLAAYCEHNYNPKETASYLHIHYNSLQYRLKKISEITQIDLSSSEGLFQFMIGLKVRKLL